MAVLPTATESPLLYACELWVFAMCPALRGSTVSYAGDAHFPKHSLEYSLNFWSQSKKKRYVFKLPSMGSQARAINLALLGHTPCVIANIHGPFSRDQREKLDAWLAQLPDLGILMGDFNDCVWGRPSQPTRY